MPLITINAGTVYRLAVDALQDALEALDTPVPLVAAHEEDPAGGGAFVRLHAIVMPERRGRPDDPDARRVMVRATAQVPTTDFAANGLALHDLAHATQAALAAARLAEGAHQIHFEDGFVNVPETVDESLRMRDAQITWPAVATRTSGND